MADRNQYHILLDQILICTSSSYIQAATDYDFEKYARDTLHDSDLADHLKKAGRKEDAVSATRDRIDELFDGGRAAPASQPKPTIRPETLAPLSVQQAGPPEASNGPHSRCFQFDTARGLADFCDAMLRSGLGIGHDDIRVSRDPLGLRVTTSDPFPDDSWSHVVSSRSGHFVSSLNGTLHDLNHFARMINLPASSLVPEKSRALMLSISADSVEDLREPIVRTFENTPSHRRLECKYFSDSLMQLDGRIMLFVLVEMEQPLSKAELQRWITTLPEATDVYYPLAGGQQSQVMFLKLGYIDPGSILPRLYRSPDDVAYTIVSPQTSSVCWTTLSVAQNQSALAVSCSPAQIDLAELEPQFPDAAGSLEPWEVELQVYPSTLPQSLAGRGHRVKQLVHSRERLADLEDQFERGEQWVSEQCRVAMEFSASAEDTENRLPESLRRFLDRPYVRLEDYDLSCYEWNKRQRYLVISRSPLDLAEALSSGASNLYIQDIHWLGWGVNVFIEQGKRFRPRIDSAAIAEQFRETLEIQSDGRQIHSWLIRTIGSTAIPMGIPSDSVKPLNNSMQIVNECSFPVDSARSVKYSQSAKKAFTEQLENSEPLLNDFYRKCAEEIDALLEELGGKVADIVQRIIQLQEDADRSRQDVENMEELFQNYPRNWEEFVRTILGFHLSISEQRLGLFRTLQLSHEEYQKKHADAIDTFQSSATILDEIRSKVAKNERKLERDIKSCEKTWKTADEDLAAIQHKIKSTWKTVRHRLGKLEPKTRSLQNEQKRLAETTRTLKSLESEVDAMVAGCIEKVAETDKRITRLKKEKKSLEIRIPQCKAIIEETKSELNSQVRQLRGMLIAIEEKSGKLNATAPFRKAAELLLETMREKRPMDLRSRFQAIRCFAKILKTMPEELLDQLSAE